MPRAKGFAPWKPQKRTLPLLEDIEAVLDEYREHLPLTVRQVFYRLVGKGHPKTENFYNSVGDVCNRARRSGRIPFGAIRDDGVSRQGGEWGTYESPLEYYEAHEEMGNYYARSWHDDQPVYVQVLCEAQGMIPLLERAVGPYRVPVASCSGFDSLTAKHDLFRGALRRYEEHEQDTVLLHLGDHDPSGWWMHRSMEEDLQAFCEDHAWAPEDLIDLRRVALTPRQIRTLGVIPQPEPVKPKGHGKAFIEQGLEPAAQLEAVPPDTLSALARQAVESALDLDVLRESWEREAAEREEVQEKLDVVNEALREAFGLD
jgi:hypothetical protein